VETALGRSVATAEAVATVFSTSSAAVPPLPPAQTSTPASSTRGGTRASASRRAARPASPVAAIRHEVVAVGAGRDSWAALKARELTVPPSSSPARRTAALSRSRTSRPISLPAGLAHPSRRSSVAMPAAADMVGVGCRAYLRFAWRNLLPPSRPSVPPRIRPAVPRENLRQGGQPGVTP
jgi:hypothetical protein